MIKQITHIILFLIISISLQAQLKMYATLNGGSSDSIFSGSPIYLHIQLYNSVDEYAAIHNTTVERNIQKIKEDLANELIGQDDYDTEYDRLTNAKKTLNPKKVSPRKLFNQLQIFRNDTLISPKHWTSCKNSDTKRPEIILNGKNRIHWFIAIPPQVSESWKNGQHILYAKTDDFTSNLLKLVISDNASTDAPGLSEQISLAYFHLDCDDPKLALRMANQLFKEGSENLDIIVLKADALLENEQYDNALKLFNKALEKFYREYPDSYEPPFYLIEQINYLEEILAK